MHKTVPSAGYLRFLWAGLFKHPQTGALLPSQRFLIQAMIAPVPPGYRGRVLELGCGNGTLTMRLAARCRDATILACEIDPVLAQATRQNLTNMGIDGRVRVQAIAAQELLAQIRASPGERPGYIVSGLPLGNLGKRAVLELLQAISGALPESGMFIQTQHLLLDRKHIRAVFGNLRTIPVLLNVLPAFVYYAKK